MLNIGAFTFTLSVLLSLIILKFYFNLALKYSIVDNPNSRSSHITPTVRGSGIIIPIIWIFWFLISDYQFPFLTLGLLLVSIIGFCDDIKPVNPYIRLVGQTFAFLLLWYQLMGNIKWDIWLVPIAIVSIGALNAVNFMDGINGITGLYALSILIPLQIHFAPQFLALTPWLCIIIAILSFGWFNFRKNALCFAGDVGSLSLGYIFVFFILALMFGKDPLNLQSAQSFEFNFAYILLLKMYGLDVILTLFQRLFARQKLFIAHRMHLYQILVNERKIPHLLVSSIYAIIQLIFSVWVLWFTPSPITTTITIAMLTLVYLFVKYAVTPRV